MSSQWPSRGCTVVLGSQLLHRQATADGSKPKFLWSCLWLWVKMPIDGIYTLGDMTLSWDRSVWVTFWNGAGHQALTHTHGRPQHTAMRNCDRKDHRPSWLLKVKIHGDLDQILRSQKCSKDLMDPNCFFLLRCLSWINWLSHCGLRSEAGLINMFPSLFFHAQRPKIAKCQALRKYPWKSQNNLSLSGELRYLGQIDWCFWMICLLWCARQNWGVSLGQWHVLWTIDLMSLSIGCFQNVNHGRIRNFPSEVSQLENPNGICGTCTAAFGIPCHDILRKHRKPVAVKSLGTSNSSHIVRANPKNFTIHGGPIPISSRFNDGEICPCWLDTSQFSARRYAWRRGIWDMLEALSPCKFCDDSGT